MASRKLWHQCLVMCGLCALNGCANIGCCLTSISNEESQISYTVFGFGRITVPVKGTTDVVASRVTALGFTWADQPGLRASMGYSTSSILMIPRKDANVLVEAKSCGPTGIAVRTFFPNVALQTIDREGVK